MTREEFNEVQWHKGMKAISRLRGVECEMEVVDVDLESYKIGLNYLSTSISRDCEDVELVKDFMRTSDSIVEEKGKDDRVRIIARGVVVDALKNISMATLIITTIVIFFFRPYLSELEHAIVSLLVGTIVVVYASLFLGGVVYEMVCEWRNKDRRK
ncbi:hypothetical protein [Porphyromonas somerae]|uniref:hypothetical protein n=1 Tax=Porphyromonas somerae TaxID=322095 RepID=UPI00036E301D|nr:hypothetical protein [Porphyromonas somerae]